MAVVATLASEAEWANEAELAVVATLASEAEWANEAELALATEADTCAAMLIWFVLAEITIFSPATRDLNCSSLPTFWAKSPSPEPIFFPVFASPATSTKLAFSQAVIEEKSTSEPDTSTGFRKKVPCLDLTHFVTTSNFSSI